ncbi:MAG: N-formylglutamate amidohydrolase [Deltaproteobacteria bacterium]|nr:N-formylglutamate amidohydrolase [Deltaproteobacteria bacterium]
MPRAPLFHVEECDRPYELVEVAPAAERLIPEEYRDQVMVHTVHDGNILPPEFYADGDGKPLVNRRRLNAQFIQERDWGANLVASRIAAAMGVGGYYRCRIARALLDFNRFPGASPPGVHGSLERLAIGRLYTTKLDHELKMRLLEDYYDRISDAIEQVLLGGKLIMLAIHTYDARNASKTRRPHLSLLSSLAHYERESRMPFGVFDPMYPDVLGETTCSRTLRDRISLNLERKGFRVLHNHPYSMPEGSMEVRAQVWFFFCFLRRHFLERYPDSRTDPAYRLVWDMLLNTNLRTQQAEALRGYLHRFRKMPGRRRKLFEDALLAYHHIARFQDSARVLSKFRHWKARPSSIGLEVRKDIICSFDDNTGRPLPLTTKQAAKATLIGNVVAEAITTYFETDRVQS